MIDTEPKTPRALFHAVQLARLFEDSKTFADAVARAPAEHIEAEFRALLRDFVARHYTLPPPAPAATPAGDAPLAAHIDALWDSLAREPDRDDQPAGSHIALPHPYVVPGGRFGELYYWDSYFTMEGLAASGRLELVEAMVRNFAWLIERHGHVPNGTRSYLASRSQPPMFAFMLELLERERGFDAIAPFLPQLEREYRFWMDEAGGRLVRLPDGARLNRYWDARNAPREEAFAEDVELAEHAASERQGTIWRDLRAAAESGWDFSSRWCAADGELATIRTTELAPVDLNCLLYRLERDLAAWLARLGEARAADYAQAAERRRIALLAHCWDEAQGWFFDCDWRDGRLTGCWSLAGVFPLYCAVADADQAARVAQNVEARFLRPGGLVTTLTDSPQQWDAPNGWAPLQWAAVEGLRAYGHAALAREIATRFVALADAEYRRSGRLMEKYDVCVPERRAGGGEYPVQDGFGWTNGVLRAFIERFGLPQR